MFTITNGMTIVGLVNGMIGGIILVLPVLALHAGSALVGPIAIVLGFFSFFSCWLCLRHLRNYQDLDEAIYYHFGKQKGFRIFYDINMLISISVLLLLYFILICEQWQSMTEPSKIIPILNALVLFPIVYVMKKFNFGATLLAYGILSVIGYIIFLIWMLITTQQTSKEVPVATPLFVELASALSQGFAIQTIFIPILKKNLNRQYYTIMLAATYILGVAIYTFIGYAGTYSIVGRETIGAETIQDYFEDKQWQVIVLQVIYLVHLYSAFPQFLLIAKRRFYGLLEIPEGKDVRIQDVIYVGVTIFICLIVKLTEIRVTILIVLNGSIVSFFFIYVIPISLHLKCLYFTQPEDRIHSIEQVVEKNKEKESKQNKQNNCVPNKQPPMAQLQQVKIQCNQGPQLVEVVSQRISDIQTVSQNKDIIANTPKNTNQKLFNSCQIEYPSKILKTIQLMIIVLMIITGLLIMADAIYDILGYTHNPSPYS